MARDLKRTTKTASSKQRFDKPPSSPSPAKDPERKQPKKPKAKPKIPGARAKALEMAEAEYGVRSGPMTDAEKKAKRAALVERRRDQWVQLNTEVSPEDYAHVLGLTVEHGSIKAVIAHLIATSR